MKAFDNRYQDCLRHGVKDVFCIFTEIYNNFFGKTIHFTYTYVTRKPLEKTHLKSLLFYTYYENHHYFTLKSV